MANPVEITDDPIDAHLIMLDDWSISGGQLGRAATEILYTHPEFAKRLSVQLVAAPAKILDQGLNVHTVNRDNSTNPFSIPVEAYFRAHDSSTKGPNVSGAHITGYYCSTDSDFNNDISGIASITGMDMPPSTNIVRPYHKPGFKLEEIAGLQRSISPVDTSPSNANPVLDAGKHETEWPEGNVF